MAEVCHGGDGSPWEVIGQQLIQCHESLKPLLLSTHTLLKCIAAKSEFTSLTNLDYIGFTLIVHRVIKRQINYVPAFVCTQISLVVSCKTCP